MNRRSILRGVIAAIVAPREILSTAIKPDPESGYWEYTFGENHKPPVWRTFTVNAERSIRMQPGVMIEFPVGVTIHRGDYVREEVTFTNLKWRNC